MAGRFENRVVFITGASAGIGRACALEFAREGAAVVAAARRRDKLDTLVREITDRGGRAAAVACDVRDRASLDAAAAEAAAAFGGFDVVFANAGYGVTGSAFRLETEDFRAQFETNVFGVLDTIYATLPHARSDARYAAVGSIMGRLGMPASGPYTASKFAVCGFGECFYYDFRERGMSFTLINPGLVESDIRSTNNDGVYLGNPDPAPQWLVMPAATAARHIVRAIHRRKPEYIVTGHGKIAVLLNRACPRALRLLFRLGSRSGLNKVEQAKRQKAGG